MRIDLAEIERRQVNIFIGQGDENGSVDCGITSVCGDVRLNGGAGVVTRQFKMRVGQIKLGDPRHKARDPGRRGRDVGIVETYSLTGVFPAEKHLATGKGQGNAAVAGNGRAAILPHHVGIQTPIGIGNRSLIQRRGARGAHRFTQRRSVRIYPSRIGLIDDGEAGKVLPRQARLIGRA